MDFCKPQYSCNGCVHDKNQKLISSTCLLCRRMYACSDDYERKPDLYEKEQTR